MAGRGWAGEANPSVKDGSPVRGWDLLNREAIDGAHIAMPFQGVRLIEQTLDE